VHLSTYWIHPQSDTLPCDLTPILRTYLCQIWLELDPGDTGKVTVGTIVAKSDLLSRKAPNFVETVSDIAKQGQVSYEDFKNFMIPRKVRTQCKGYCADAFQHHHEKRANYTRPQPQQLLF
jgi:hypothetical protein